MLHKPRLYRAFLFQKACIVCGEKTYERVSHRLFKLEAATIGRARQVNWFPRGRAACHYECHEYRCNDAQCVESRMMKLAVHMEAEAILATYE